MALPSTEDPMTDPELLSIAEAQVAQYRRSRILDDCSFGLLLARSRGPTDVRNAILKERPLAARLAELSVGEPDPAALREEAAAVGLLAAEPQVLALRRLYPSLDLGVYCASHSMGKPSAALPLAMELHHGQHHAIGIGVWHDGTWLAAIDDFREAVAELVGSDLGQGEVVWFANVSEALSALLWGQTGRLVTTEGHFTTAHYIHQAWAERTGSVVVRIPVDADELVTTAQVVEALTEDTTVVSLSHAHYRTGLLQDVEAIGAAMAERCPEAVLLLDAYQTLGTVPVDVADLPPRTAVLGGGHKQLRAGTGAGFAWLGSALVDRLDTPNTGWWAHRAPMEFDHGPFVPAEGAGRLCTGTPSVGPMVALVTELRVLSALGGGDLGAAVRRVRERSQAQIGAALELARDLGLRVRGGRDPSSKAAFLAVWLPDGRQVVEHLDAEGVIVDFRADSPGGSAGLVRVSANSVSFSYELEYALRRVKRYSGRM